MLQVREQGSNLKKTPHGPVELQKQNNYKMMNIPLRSSKQAFVFKSVM